MAEGEISQSWSLRNFLSLKAEPKTTGREIPGRYKHDLEQAELIQRGMKPQAKSSQLTEDDILLGLKGLDQADILRERGEYEKSLKIGEMAMELLIEFLKADLSVLPGVNRQTISQRVQCALTDAEEVKKSIKKSTAGNKQNTSPSSQSNASGGTSRDLSEALAGAVRKVQVSYVGSQTAGQSTSSPKRQTSPQHSLAPSCNLPPNSSGRASKFYNSQDPLVQTVKQELYVDQSQLQEISWDDIAGLENAKQSLQENAILPMIRPDLFTGLRRPRNILLYGPPGTGKTLLVKAVARESQCLLFICTASSLTSKWHGEGEKLLRTLFQVARAAAPSIIFVDEMDALLSSRKSDGEHEASRRFKTEFMTQVDGIVQGSATNGDGNHLLLIACTNCPWDIDPAIMRRFPRRIYIPLPDTKARKALLKKLLVKAGKHNLTSTDIKAIVKRLSGFSGSDIASIASDASFGPIRSLGGLEAIRGVTENEIRPISMEDFENAIVQATKSVGKKQIQVYEEWAKEQAAS